ncbi:MAG TPA: BTAD domain-containing putative transcriptional regulator [Acidimicrobiales bacterium]|nr:BTAD domain-containing putative transcriptional regulator [Acidimicrobiales bacterium]
MAEHEGLAVFASAGSGKTVQAQLFAERDGWPVAWLTLDEGDRSPSRMLSYLAAALEVHVPEVAAVRDAAFSQALTMEEVAAVLAEQIGRCRLLVVVDQCEAIADAHDTCSALETFIDYLPGTARALLLSRSELSFSLGRLILHGRVARVTDKDLALTLDEAEELVRAGGGETADLASRWEASRGWMAGVAFGHMSPLTGTALHAADFSSYLSYEILQTLPEDERRFLLDTSILEAVSVKAATTLCGPEARAVWRSIGLRHIPATTTPDGTIVYHPCLREFLRGRLELNEPERLVELQRRHVSLLMADGSYEDAVELLVDLGLLDQAAEAAEQAVAGLIQRGDWQCMLRWADVLGAERINSRPALVAMHIRGLRGGRHLTAAAQLVRELDKGGRMRAVADADPGVMSHVGWAMQWHPLEGVKLLEKYGVDYRVMGVRYFLGVVSQDDVVLPPRGSTWVEADRLISWGLMLQGRLDELVGMLPGEDQWPPRSPYRTPHPLLGLVWRGEVARARALWEQVWEELSLHPQRQGLHTDVWHFMEAWLLMAEGDAPGAVKAAEQAVAESRETGFGLAPLFQAGEAFALIGTGQVQEAVELLEESMAASKTAGLLAYVEWAETFLALARLMQGRDQDAAETARRAVGSMQQSQRIVMLPLAAVCLAEAEHRLGRDDEADAIATLALDASDRMSAYHWLQTALKLFPGVLSRQLEWHSSESRWRRLGMPRTASSGPGPRARAVDADQAGVVVVDVQPFGTEPKLFVDAEPLSVGRLKVLELACYLTLHPNGVTRDDVQLHLFPETDHRRAGNHFRQVVHQLRKASGLTLQRLPGAKVAWSAAVRADATDLRFERLLGEAWSAAGMERLNKLQAALALTVGPYLAASDLDWVAARRYELEVMEEEASLEAARLSLDFEDHEGARAFAETVVARDPYSEAAYRILIEVEAAVGSEAAGLATYRRAVQAMREIGLEPDGTTRALLSRFAH